MASYKGIPYSLSRGAGAPWVSVFGQRIGCLTSRMGGRYWRPYVYSDSVKQDEAAEFRTRREAAEWVVEKFIPVAVKLAKAFEQHIPR